MSDIQKSVDTQQERAGESLERKPFTILLRVNANCQILFFLLCFQQCPVSQLILLNSLEVWNSRELNARLRNCVYRSIPSMSQSQHFRANLKDGMTKFLCLLLTILNSAIFSKLIYFQKKCQFCTGQTNIVKKKSLKFKICC